jgi:hypothetical protein
LKRQHVAYWIKHGVPEWREDEIKRIMKAATRADRP